MSAGISRHINGTINASWSGNFLPVPAVRQVSWLTDHHTKPPSQSFHDSLSNCPSSSVTAHSRMVLYSLLTVTRSYRSSTCFPFTCCPPVLMNFFTAAAAPDASSIVMGDILALQKLLCNRLYKKRGQIFWSVPVLSVITVFIRFLVGFSPTETTVSDYGRSHRPDLSRQLPHPVGSCNCARSPLSESTRNPDSGTGFRRRTIPRPGCGYVRGGECPLVEAEGAVLS